jgi:hypothetical protein
VSAVRRGSGEERAALQRGACVVSERRWRVGPCIPEERAL